MLTSSRGEIAARELRESLGAGSRPIVSMRSLIRQRDDLVLVERPLLASLDGAYAFDDQLLIGFIYLNAKPVWTRRRFTMAHELGHHILHHGQRVDKNVFDLYDTTESDANAFAAELLIPAEGIMEAPRINEPSDVAELAAHFMVSGRAMLVRLSSLKLITSPQKKAFESTYDSKFYARFWEGRPPDQEDTARTVLPEKFVTTVLDLYRQGSLTRDAAREALDIGENEAEDVLPPVADDAEFLRRVGAGVGISDEDRV